MNLLIVWMKCVAGSATNGLQTSIIIFTLCTDDPVVRLISMPQVVSESDMGHIFVVNFISDFWIGAPSDSSINIL